MATNPTSKLLGDLSRIEAAQKCAEVCNEPNGLYKLLDFSEPPRIAK
jgi:hypothetical protein